MLLYKSLKALIVAGTQQVVISEKQGRLTTQ